MTSSKLLNYEITHGLADNIHYHYRTLDLCLCVVFTTLCELKFSFVFWFRWSTLLCLSDYAKLRYFCRASSVDVTHFVTT